MADSVADLLGTLDLAETGEDHYRGESPTTSLQRVFGGQVLGQALVAAGRTVPAGRAVHSLHAYFLRPGDPAVPIDYAVERSREGRAFSTRRVVARQREAQIFVMSSSFQVAEEGLDHQDPMPAALDPDTLPTMAERATAEPQRWAALAHGWRSFDVRPAVRPGERWQPVAGHASHTQVWFRATGPLPDEPLAHASALAYVSDLTFLPATLVPHGLSFPDPRIQMASLDHAMWFHRAFRVDEWLLYDQISPSAQGSRGLASGRIFDTAGRLVASVMQEGLIRVRPARQEDGKSYDESGSQGPPR